MPLCRITVSDVTGQADTLPHAGLQAVVDTMHSGRRAPLSGALAADTQLCDLLDELVELHEFVLALSKGNLSGTLAAKGSTAGALKALHASLRHLAWQTQRVAAGDFSQRVDFMGDFSASFNGMVAALQRSRQELDERNALLRTQTRRLEEMAATDSLTGVFNRRKFDDLTRDEIERAFRYERAFSIVLLDVDHVKAVNDERGHQAGDAVLVELAALVCATVRSVDAVARWGGEEFVLLLPEVGLTGATRAAQRVRDAIHEAGFGGGVTASFGVAAYRAGETADELFGRVDEALYRAKEAGRDRIAVAG